VTTITRWRIALWLIALGAILYISLQAVGALVPFAVGAVLAYAMSPLVDRMSHVVPARSHQGDVYRRGFAVILIYVALASLLFLAGSQIIPIAVDQIAQFVDTLPVTVAAARDQLNEWLEVYRNRVPTDVQTRIDSGLDDALNTATDAAAALAERTVGVVTGTIGLIFGFAIVPFWMFYAMRDRHYAGNNFLNAIPAPFQRDATNLMHIADQLIGRYIRAQLFLGLVVGSAVGIALTLLDVQMSLALGFFAGVTELIPIIGPWIGAVPGLIIIAATDPDKFIWVALVYLIIQQVENVLLVPRIQGNALEMHPAMILLLLAIGGAAFGLIGLLLIVPVSSLAREVFWYVDRRLRGEAPEVALAAGHVGRVSLTDPESPVEPTPSRPQLSQSQSLPPPQHQQSRIPLNSQPQPLIQIALEHHGLYWRQIVRP
jgi:predicted PurR-regulated permease PerM